MNNVKNINLNELGEYINSINLKGEFVVEREFIFYLLFYLHLDYKCVFLSTGDKLNKDIIEYHRDERIGFLSQIIKETNIIKHIELFIFVREEVNDNWYDFPNVDFINLLIKKIDLFKYSNPHFFANILFLFKKKISNYCKNEFFGSKYNYCDLNAIKYITDVLKTSLLNNKFVPDRFLAWGNRIFLNLFFNIILSKKSYNRLEVKIDIFFHYIKEFVFREIQILTLNLFDFLKNNRLKNLKIERDVFEEVFSIFECYLDYIKNNWWNLEVKKNTYSIIVSMEQNKRILNSLCDFFFSKTNYWRPGELISTDDELLRDSGSNTCFRKDLFQPKTPVMESESSRRSRCFLNLNFCSSKFVVLDSNDFNHEESAREIEIRSDFFKGNAVNYGFEKENVTPLTSRKNCDLLSFKRQRKAGCVIVQKTQKESSQENNENLLENRKQILLINLFTLIKEEEFLEKEQMWNQSDCVSFSKNQLNLIDYRKSRLKFLELRQKNKEILFSLLEIVKTELNKFEKGILFLRNYKSNSNIVFEKDSIAYESEISGSYKKENSYLKYIGDITNLSSNPKPIFSSTVNNVEQRDKEGDKLNIGGFDEVGASNQIVMKHQNTTVQSNKGIKISQNFWSFTSSKKRKIFIIGFPIIFLVIVILFLFFLKKVIYNKKKQ